MSTSVDETQNPELARWSDTGWQTEQWLIRLKNLFSYKCRLSASQWLSPLNLSFPVLNDPEQVSHQWTADTLRVAIVTPQAIYLKRKWGEETYYYKQNLNVCAFPFIQILTMGSVLDRKAPQMKRAGHTLCVCPLVRREHTTRPGE